MHMLNTITGDFPSFQAAVDEKRPYKPLYVKIKLFYGCNLKCEMCSHWRETREPPISIDRFKEILTELAALGCQKVHFSGGESMLRPRVPELVAHAASLGIRPVMTSNGTLIDKEKAKALVEAGLRGINISIDSPDRKTHDRIRGVRGAWKAACRAVTLFRRYAHKGKITVRINTVVGRSNYDTLAAMPDLAHSLGADALNLIAIDDHCGEHLSPRKADLLRYNTEIAPQLAERALALGLFRSAEEAYIFGQDETDIKRARRGQYALGWYDKHPCHIPWMHSLIDYNGLVYVCCMTREQIPPLGDLKTSTFAEIWNGPAYQQVRGLMHPPALAPCRRCDDFLIENRRLAQLRSENASLSS
jgi:MoaA/NifB/PqqE/SkfB family radical SAM enzyme